MAVDRWTRKFLRELDDLDAKPIHLSAPDEARVFMRRVMESNGSGPAMHRVFDETAPRPDGSSVPLRILIPTQRPLGVVVYYHGGGWVTGSVAETETIARKLAERTNCAFVMVEYRRAPEHPYPVAVDDSYAGLEWAWEHRADLAGDVPLMVAGDDVGGNLAAVVALRARDRQGPPLAMQILVCPVVDANLDDGAWCDAEPGSRSWVGPEALRWGWDQYLPRVDRRSEAEASPLRAENLAGLPPAVIVTAEHSAARTGAEAYAQRLREAGVAVNAQRYDEQIHGFFTLLLMPQGERAFQQFIKAVRAHVLGAERPRSV